MFCRRLSARDEVSRQQLTSLHIRLTWPQLQFLMKEPESYPVIQILGNPVQSLGTSRQLNDPGAGCPRGIHCILHLTQYPMTSCWLVRGRGGGQLQNFHAGWLRGNGGLGLLHWHLPAFHIRLRKCWLSTSEEGWSWGPRLVEIIMKGAGPSFLPREQFSST